MTENLKDVCGDFAVEFHVWRREDCLGATFVGRSGGHGGMDSEAPRFVGAGRDDTAFVRSGADDQRLAPPLGVVEKFDGCEEGIHIHMKYRRHTCAIIPFSSVIGTMVEWGGMLPEMLFLCELAGIFVSD